MGSEGLLSERRRKGSREESGDCAGGVRSGRSESDGSDTGEQGRVVGEQENNFVGSVQLAKVCTVYPKNGVLQAIERAFSEESGAFVPG